MSVFDPDMSGSLISADRLIEADYNVIFRIPSNAASDGLSPKRFSQYGGTVTTPDGLTIIFMEYVSNTWRLPKPGAPKVLSTNKSSSTLEDDFEVRVPDQRSF